jgi:hypothetical protein
MQVQTKIFARAILAALGDGASAAGLLSGGFIRPYTAIAGSPSPATVTGDLTFAAGAGMAAQAFVVAAQTDSTDGLRSELLGATLLFPGDDLTDEVVIGLAWMSAATAGVCWGLDPIPGGYPLHNSLASLLAVPVYGDTFAWDHGTTLIIS